MRQVLSILFSFCLVYGIGQNQMDNFFTKANLFFENHVQDQRINYSALSEGNQLKSLIEDIEALNIEDQDQNTQKAFLINAYNLHVINLVSQHYPISSVQSVTGFFDRKKVNVGGNRITLNSLEKKHLIEKFGDPRLHFVLVCGAVGCPPITNFAYTPEHLESQILQQTKMALNDNAFIRENENKVELSQIFKWYKKDFGGSNKSIITFINQFRSNDLDEDIKIGHYTYDWELNERKANIADFDWETGEQVSNSNNASRYVVSSTIPIGTSEIKIFNNLYSQKTGDGITLFDRSSFFTTSISALYGLNSRFNIGVLTRIRKVRNNTLPSSPFSVFGSSENGSSRSGLTAIGPQIRFAPIPEWSNFSIQSSLVFPIGSDLAGGDNQIYIDWAGPTWNTQLFNDFSIGDDFSLFTEFDVLLEDIGKASNGRQNRLSTPVTIIFSYLPIRNLTFYMLGGYSPYWQKEYDYFTQIGLGSKYQFNSSFEVELLYTDFSNKFLNNNNGQAATYNLGLRINI